MFFKTFTTSLLAAAGLGIAQWSAVQLYATYCMPSGISGLLYSFFIGSSPPCYALNLLQYKVQSFYIAIWFSLAVGVVSLLKGIIDILANKLENGFVALRSVPDIREERFRPHMFGQNENENMCPITRSQY